MFTHYRIPYLFDYITRPGRLLNIWTLRVGAYSRLGLIFSKCSMFILQQNNKCTKREDVTKQGFC